MVKQKFVAVEWSVVVREYWLVEWEAREKRAGSQAVWMPPLAPAEGWKEEERAGEAANKLVALKVLMVGNLISWRQK
jgi:hypothetical protein